MMLVSQLTFSFQNSKKEQNNSLRTTLKFPSHSSFSTTFCLKRLLLSLSRIYNRKSQKPTKHLEQHFSISKRKGLFLLCLKIELQFSLEYIGICWLTNTPNTPKVLSLVRTAASTTNISPSPSGFTLLHICISLILFKYLQKRAGQLKARLPAALLLQNDLCQWKNITIPNFSQASFSQGLSLIFVGMLKNTSWGTLLPKSPVLAGVWQYFLTHSRTFWLNWLESAHRWTSTEFQHVMHAKEGDSKQQYNSIF